MLMVKNALPDVQDSADARGISLNMVGVSAVEMPLQLRGKEGALQSVVAVVRMSVGLAEEKRGTHLSRFIEQLSEWSKKTAVGLDFEGFLCEMAERLQAKTAQVKLEFQYFIEKSAPISKISSPMGYRCSFRAALNRENGDRENGKNDYQSILGVQVPVSTLCPCSKAISEYGAHNQRALIQVDAFLENDVDRPVWIEDLVAAIEDCSSCSVYPILKREDEKYVTERQYENPMFVEDVCREVTLLLRTYGGVRGFAIEVEALESIHGHNAWTAHQESFQSL